MEQQTLPTELNRTVVHGVTALRGRHRDLLAAGKSFRVTYFQLQALLVGMDALLLLTAMLAALRLSSPYSFADTGLAMSVLHLVVANGYWVAMLLGTWFLFGWLNDLFDLQAVQFKWLSAARIVIAGLLSAAAAVLFAFPLQISSPGAFLPLYLGLGLLLVTAWRFTYAALAGTSLFVRKVVILGTETSARMTAALLNETKGLQYKVLGFVAETSNLGAGTCGGLPVWHVSTPLAELVRDLRADTIVIGSDGELSPTLYKELIACQSQGLSVWTMPGIYQRLCRKVPVEYVNSSWLLEIIQCASSREQQFCKRALDLAVVLLALPWFLLVFPLIALAIKLDSRGPILYQQVRTGLGGKPFQILKFRTMVTDAERDGKPRWASKNDPRITRVGRILRKSRLDEIPQFINVLWGDMSLIGPRPERPEFVEQLDKELPHYYARLLVPPGLTGWAQIKYTYGSSVEDALIKLQYDVYYVRNWSVLMDLYILFQTVSVVLRGKGT